MSNFGRSVEIRPLYRNRTKETVIATATCAPAAPCEDRRIAKSRRALRGALVELMEERGYDALTVNDLCERADTSRGTFYNHFRDKDGLLAVLEDEVMADLDALQERMQSITLADMLAWAREEFAAALLLQYGYRDPESQREIPPFLAKNLTKAQIMSTIELLETYHGECAYNVGVGHVLGALAAELEGIL